MRLLKRIISKMSLLSGHELVAEYSRFDKAVEEAINTNAPTLGEFIQQKHFGDLNRNGYSLLFTKGSIEVIYRDNFITEIYLKTREV